MLISDMRNGRAELKKIGRMTKSSLLRVIIVKEVVVGRASWLERVGDSFLCGVLV